MTLKEAIQVQASKHASQQAQSRGLKKPFETFSMREGMEAHMELKKHNIIIEDMKIYQDDKVIATIEFIWSNLISKSGYRLPKNFKITYA